VACNRESMFWGIARFSSLLTQLSVFMSMAYNIIWSRCLKFVIFVALVLGRLRNRMSVTVLSVPLVC